MALPFDLSAGAGLWLAALILGAAVIRGYSGFGFSALVVAGAALVTQPLHFVAVVLICEVILTAQAARGALPDVDWGRVGRLMAGAVVGLPLGVWALTSVGIDTARIVIAVFVLAMCAILLAGWRVARELRGLPEAGVGLASGLANAAAMAGLPVAAFFAAQPISPAGFRATLIAYFAIVDLATLPFLWRAGHVSGDSLLAVGLALPLLLLGNWAGSRRFLAAAPRDFRRMAIGLLAVLALLGLGRAFV